MQRNVMARAAVRVGLGIGACLLLASLSLLAERRVEASKPAAMFGTFPPGFVSEVIAGAGLEFPTSLAFTSGNRMFITLKGGVVRVMQNGALLPTPFIDLSNEVNEGGDRGLLSIAIHPNFPTTPYVYLLYTYEPPGVTNPDQLGARVSRLMRVSANPSNPNVASTNPADRVIILGTNSTLANSGNTTNEEDLANPACGVGPNYVTDCLASDSSTHSIGTVKFGNDGKLYVSNGDGAGFRSVDRRALRSLDLDSLSGKILRIDPITGAGLNDNPFWNGSPSANRSKVYSYGLRNPFRFTIRPSNGELYIGDVGWGTWEEVNTGRAKNFGWPCYEGGFRDGTFQSLRQPSYENDATTSTRCSQLYAQGTSAVQAPAYAFQHSLNGGSVVMGSFYTGTSYPAEYRGALFFGDYTNFNVRSSLIAANGSLSPSIFAFNVEDIGGPVFMTQGPDTNLYYIALGLTSEIRRLRYVGGGNNPPTANASANVTSGNAPLNVTFSSAGSFDADGQPLSYFWDFGDGTTSNLPNPSKIYSVAGSYNVRLTVTDTPGAQGTATLVINVSNTRPVVTINSPANGTRYNVGTVISFSGTATDAEEGNISNRIEWKALLRHADHQHFDFFTFTGAGGTYTIPDHGDDTYFELCATVTDNAGATSVVQCRELRPNTVQYTFQTVPSGLQVNYDGTTRATPFTVTTIPNSRHSLSVAEVQSNFRFRNWSDGGARSHEIIIGNANQTLTATYEPLASNTYLSDLTPTFAVNAIGPYERDMSNGGAAAGDGKRMFLNSTYYRKGLGVSARSELRYNLGGLFKDFQTDIGVDDEVGSLGLVVFRVMVDGVEVYKSTLMSGRTATQSLNLNVTGKNELRLIVEPAVRTGTVYDKADWANARLTR
jgi:glucose/arabinose dehydrogenase